MQKLFNSLEEISHTHLETLQHAAEISSYVTSCTLGPQNEYALKQDEESLVDDALEKRREEDLPKTISPASSNTKSLSNHNQILSMQSLDFHTINAIVLFREAQQQRLKSARKQLISLATARNSSIDAIRERICSELEICIGADSQLKKRYSDVELESEAEATSVKQWGECDRQLDALRKQTHRKLQVIAFEAVSQYQQQFRGKYEIVANLLVSINKQTLLACADYNSQLKELIQLFDQMITRIKAGDCGLEELTTAENLCRSLDTLESSIIGDLENIVKNEQQKADEYKAAAAAEVVVATQAAQQEDHQRQNELQQQEEVKAVVAKPMPAAAAPAINEDRKQVTSEAGAQFATAERVQFYTQINAIYAEKEANAKTMQADEANKRYCFGCKKAIINLVNTIDAHSPQRLQDRFDKLYGFFCGQSVNTNCGQVNINDHPLSRDFCLLVMARQFILQAASNQRALYAVASVIVSLWKLMPDFGFIFLACMFKESPLLVPFTPVKRRSQSVEEFMQLMGYHYDADKTPETFENFLKRQSSIARLYSAVMVSNGRQADAALPHPYSLDQTWRWLTNLITLETLPDVSAAVLLQVLECASADMLAAYGRQYIKILIYVQQHYCPRMRASDEPRGTYERIENLLAQFLDKGQLPKQTGRLAPNFW